MPYLVCKRSRRRLHRNAFLNATINNQLKRCVGSYLLWPEPIHYGGDLSVTAATGILRVSNFEKKRSKRPGDYQNGNGPTNGIREPSIFASIFAERANHELNRSSKLGARSPWPDGAERSIRLLPLMAYPAAYSSSSNCIILVGRN